MEAFSERSDYALYVVTVATARGETSGCLERRKFTWVLRYMG